MKMIRILNVILLMLMIGFCPFSSSAKIGNGKVDSANDTNIDFQKNFTGTINSKLNVVFHIDNRGGELSGFYFYASKGIDIKLSGTISGDQMEIYELDNLNNKAAKISGELKNSFFTGTWQNLSTNKIFPMSLKETKFNVAPIPMYIEGTYKTRADDSIDNSPCEVAITITKDNGAFLYQLKTKSRNYNGNITFYRDIETKEVYITLKGIKWSEYGGDMSKSNKKVKTGKLKEIMVDIEGAYSGNEITFQNDGNASNYYLVLGECDRKFVRLVKE